MDSNESEKRHFWYRIEGPALLLAVVVMPIVFWWITTDSEKQKLKLEYVRLAINILQPPSRDMAPQVELRGWAVAILDGTSPVRLSDETKQALIDGRSNLPKMITAAQDPVQVADSNPDRPGFTLKNTVAWPDYQNAKESRESHFFTPPELPSLPFPASIPMTIPTPIAETTPAPDTPRPPSTRHPAPTASSSR